MLEFCRRHDGAISVFLTMILIPTMIFGGIIIDGTRIYGSKNIISGAGDLAMNGALANYDGDLNDVYGLIAMSQDPAEINSNLQDYFESTLNANGIDPQDFNRALINLEMIEGSFNAEGVSKSEVYQTEVMKQEILEYMKYRAPVTFVNRAIIDKLDQFKNKDKEKHAIETEIEFESELDELQSKFEELLEFVEAHTAVYKAGTSNADVEKMMEEVHNNFWVYTQLGILQNRLNDCKEKTTGDKRSLMQQFCALGEESDKIKDAVDVFETLLNMRKLENGIENPNSLLDGLKKDSAEYAAISREIANFQSWKNRMNERIQIYQEMIKLGTKNTYEKVRKLYDDVKSGYDSAVDIEKKLAEVQRKLKDCRELYNDWNGAIGELPDESDTKREMAEEAKKYEPFFSQDNTQDFVERVENNKEYYKLVKEELEKLTFARQKVIEKDLLGTVNSVTEKVKTDGYDSSNRILEDLATPVFKANWSGPVELLTEMDHLDIEGTDFVKYLRTELCNGKSKGNKKQSKEKTDEWNSNLSEMLDDYLNLFTTKDIEEINIPTAGKNNLPSNWLGTSGGGGAEKEPINGNMDNGKNRKKIGKSAKSAMNTNNSAITDLSKLADSVANGAEKAMEAVYLTEYVMSMFSYYTVDKDSEGEKIENPLSLSRDALNKHELYRAEIEYIIWGAPDTRDNVAYTKTMIFAIQFVCNAIFAFTDSYLKNDALAIAAVFPVGPLAKAAIKAAVLAIVALIETTQDLNQIVKGEAVDLVKAKKNWETWIVTRPSNPGDPIHGPSAVKYEDYIWLLTCIQMLVPSKQIGVLARTADCIELNVTESKEKENNSLKSRFTMVKVHAEVKTNTFFLQKFGEQNGKALDENVFVIQYNGIQGY